MPSLRHQPCAQAGLELLDAAVIPAARVGCFRLDIEALFGAQITVGCSSEPLRFCPDLPVTRAQMATFLTRALTLPIPG